MHDLSGSCPTCEILFNRYPNFDADLKAWFLEVQKTHPEAHISCAGRGKVEQEEAYYRGASRAHYGQSSHNFNAAIDLFELREGVATWDYHWFERVVSTNLTSELQWYGKPGSRFFELPHVERSDWKELAQQGKLGLVEG